MNKYIKLIENIGIGNIIKDIENKDISYEFDKNSPDEIQKETAKLINFFYNTYIKTDCIRLHRFNNGLLYYTEEMLKHIKTLYDLSWKQGEEETQILSYYLVSLNYSYNNGNIYQESSKNKAYLELFYSIFQRKEFYNDGIIFKTAISFAREVIDYALEDKNRVLHLHDLLLDCCRIYNSTGFPDLQNNIDKFIRFGTHYNQYFIEYDQNINMNFTAYFNYELTRILDGINENVIVLKVLYKKGLIGEEQEAQILAKLKERFITLKGENSFIRKLAFFVELERDIVTLRDFSYTSSKLKDGMKTLAHEVQILKRDLVKNQNQELKAIEFETQIPKEYIEQIKKSFESNLINTIFRLYMINFNNLIEGSIENMVDSLTSFATTFTIDTGDEGLFFKEDKNIPESSFNTFYSNKLEAYIEGHRKKFLNPHLFDKKKAYGGLLRYARYCYPLQVGIPTNLLLEKYGSNIEKIVCEQASFPFGKYYNNYYIMLMSMIIQIERIITHLYNYFEKDNKTYFEDIFLERVFEYTKDNETYLNNFMHINFVLYDKNGLRIRDKIAHGNYPSGFRDLHIFLFIVVSLLFVSSLYNKIVGENKEEK